MTAISSVQKADFLVPGMHCAGCMRKIETGLADLPGIHTARTNLSTRRVHVEWVGDTQSSDGIRKALEGLGFEATLFDHHLATDTDKVQSDDLLKAMAVAGFAAANVMLLSVSVWAGLFSDMDAVTRDLFHWISALIALPAVVYAGRPFFYSAYAAFKAGHLNMDVPISLAVILAAAASLVETVRGAEHVYFDASVSLLFFLLIGRFLDRSMRRRAGEAARNLLALRAISALRVEADGTTKSTPIDALLPGDQVFVAPGMHVPADGIITSGTSDVDRGLITGESTPEQALPGTSVFAGTMNLSGPLTVKVTAARDDTLLAEIARLMDAAEQGRDAFVRLADKIARIYAPAVHVLAAATFACWFILGAGWHAALMNAIAVLIITCPCALGLAVPVVQVVASGVLLKRGLLVKSADGLERLAGVDTVVFDKTGTLTMGDLDLLDADDTQPEILQLAAALGCHSHHPLARALAEYTHGTAKFSFTDICEVPGFGVEAKLDGKALRLGRRDWVMANAKAQSVDTADHFGPELWLSLTNGDCHRFCFQDRMRPYAAHLIRALKDKGYDLSLLSGDRAPAVERLANDLGIDRWQAECKPGDKIAALEALKDKGKRVLMVGDGLNDAPALKAAHVSISPASAADISQTAADFIFQGDSIMPVLSVLSMAKTSRRRVLENFGLAFAYNAIAIPLAVAGFVTPLIAAIAMSSSSILVTLNALRLQLAGKRLT